VIGTVAPYVAGGAPISKAANLATGAIEGSGALPATARVLAGATTEGLGNYALGYGLSGGDTKQATIQGLTAGTLKGVTSSIGELANARNVPEALNSKIFKTNKAEVQAIFKGAQEDSLAKQVLDRGISGNTTDIAKQLIQGQADSEAKIAEEFAKQGNPTITLEDPQRFISYITNKAGLLEKSGATQEAQGLKSSLGAIDPQTGQITANNALSLRRFLDGLRYEKSFLAPTEELNAQQAGLKEMSDSLRGQINQIGGTGQIMKDYQFYIKALDKLAGHAVRAKNNDAIGLINTFLLGESLTSANPVLAGAAVARKVIQTTAGATKTAQFLKNLPQSSAAGSATRGIIGRSVSNGQ
jgi:hypothetical protein